MKYRYKPVQLRIILLIILVSGIGCDINEKKKKIIIIEEEDHFADASYQELGLLRLSEYGFFETPLKELIPKTNVFPYDMNTPLFTDYALKKRFMYIPQGIAVKYEEKEALDFPVGSVLIKNFYYDDKQLLNQKGKIIETRLLIHEEEGWKALPYIWNVEQTEAFLEITGGDKEVSLVDKGAFNYSIPNMAQCKSCHEVNGRIAPIGPTARQLNKEVHGKNQLLVLSESNILEGLPDITKVQRLVVWDNENSGPLDKRARAYLEINCGHCHRPEGPGKNSGLDLTIFSASDHSLGIFKGPIAAGAGSGGLNFDIVPGDPEESILTYRMESNDPGVMMPELGRKLIHTEGVELIKQWIKSMN